MFARGQEPFQARGLEFVYRFEDDGGGGQSTRVSAWLRWSPERRSSSWGWRRETMSRSGVASPRSGAFGASS
eukprot:11225316-Lingulodinium_polyedra.AAC.1